MFSMYINTLKDEYAEVNNIKLNYRAWLAKWKEDNKQFGSILDGDYEDSFYSKLGTKLIDILIASETIYLKLSWNQALEHRFNALMIKDKQLMSSKTRQKVMDIPPRLPMIHSPKLYTDKDLGGYLLNDDKYAEELIINKAAYKCSSNISTNNEIYNMANNLSIIPFKINTDLLDYLSINWKKHNLLLDSYAKHKFSDLEKKTKYQHSVLSSHNSKVVLQENILGIAEFFRKFSKIYFPIRLDQRGRIYCTPTYLNYQSNELSKALLLLSEPGIISKNNLNSISFIKAYGANCYGGQISKGSIKAKQDWVDRNLSDILNYDNGILLSKAKDKLLFLAFCMEFERFYNFTTDENQMLFYSYLPIQLDATCNGFQHMALLSNEETLFQ